MGRGAALWDERRGAGAPDCAAAREGGSMNTFRVMKPRWKPAEGEAYWYVTDTGSVSQLPWRQDVARQKAFLFGNCFKTEVQAQAARDQLMMTLAEFNNDWEEEA